ncbi:MAG TPA: hypothetical protein PKD61_01140 [Polyangiaceae bacterium]|nr:hypothetical protein [Polyangiaceae bacterium]
MSRLLGFLASVLLAACATPTASGPGGDAPSRYTGGTGPSPPSAAAQFDAGTRVVCRWRNGAVEYPGVVEGVRDGRLFVHYSDGDQEHIAPSLCRRGTTPAPAAHPTLVGTDALATGPADEVGLTPFRRDDRVACRYRGGPHDYTGTVVGLEDGRLHVHYDDGDRERITPGLCVIFRRRSDQAVAPSSAPPVVAE